MENLYFNCEVCDALNENGAELCCNCGEEFENAENDGELPECCVEDPTMVCKNHRNRMKKD